MSRKSTLFPSVRLAIETLEDRSLLSLFGSPIAYATLPNPSTPVVADFNGDGKQDFAVVSTNQGTATGVVLLNNGYGSFISTTNFAVAGPLAVGDFNSDHRPDLVVGNSVMLNLGDGTFSSAVALDSELGPLSAVGVADFNKDGLQDVAVSTGQGVSATLCVLLGDGDGTFNSNLPGTAFPSAILLQVADFNSDGSSDLVALTPGNGTGLAVVLNKGDGTFGSILHPSPSSIGDALTVGDFNNDHKPDLAVTESLGGMDILLGVGDGTFGPPITTNAGFSSILGNTSLAVADFNSDGKQDLAFGSYQILNRVHSLQEAQVLLGRGDGNFDKPGPSYFTDGKGSYDVAEGDFNGDGLADFLICASSGVPTGSSNNTINVLLNTSNRPPSGPSGIGMVDPGSATWYLRDTTGPGSPDIPAFQYGAPGWDSVVGDWNRDGLATVGVVDGATWYLRNENSAGAPDAAGPFVYGLAGWIPLAGDWSGTGQTGIGMFDPSTATWYLRNEPNAGAPDAGVFQYGGAGWIPVVGDWNGDGRVTVGIVDPQTMTWYLRNANTPGAPDVATPFQYGGVGWKPVVGDFNGDGLATIGVVDTSGAWYLRNVNSAGGADIQPFSYGLGSWTPLAGRYEAPVFHGGVFVSDMSADAVLVNAFLNRSARRTSALDAIFSSGIS